jgi:hypothetical protein
MIWLVAAAPISTGPLYFGAAKDGWATDAGPALRPGPTAAWRGHRCRPGRPGVLALDVPAIHAVDVRGEQHGVGEDALAEVHACD